MRLLIDIGYWRAGTLKRPRADFWFVPLQLFPAAKLLKTAVYQDLRWVSQHKPKLSLHLPHIYQREQCHTRPPSPPSKTATGHLAALSATSEVTPLRLPAEGAFGLRRGRRAGAGGGGTRSRLPPFSAPRHPSFARTLRKRVEKNCTSRLRLCAPAPTFYGGTRAPV